MRELALFESDVTPAAQAALCTAAAALFRLTPWQIAPEAENHLRVSCPELGMVDAVVNLTGQWATCYGFQVFPSVAAMEAHADRLAKLPGRAGPTPWYLAMSAEPEAFLMPAWRDAIVAGQWATACEESFPQPIAIGPRRRRRMLSGRDVATLEVVALGLARVLAEPTAILQAWTGGPSAAYAFTLPTQLGEVTLTLTAPHPDDAIHASPTQAPLTTLAGLRANSEVDDEARAGCDAVLLREYAMSSEGRAAGGLAYCKVLLELAAERVGHTMVTLRPQHVRSLLYRYVPLDVRVALADASALVKAWRAFFAFMGRHYGLPQAAACQRALGPHAESRLVGELSYWKPRPGARALVTITPLDGVALQ